MKIFKKLFSPKPFVPYEIFGEEGLRELVLEFYRIMETDEKARDCLLVHELTEEKVPFHVKDKLFEFLSGWTGGPQLFIKKHGPPRMRARHARFRIGSKESEQWLYCMKKALKNSPVKLKRKHKKIMFNSFAALAIRIQNQ